MKILNKLKINYVLKLNKITKISQSNNTPELRITVQNKPSMKQEKSPKHSSERDLATSGWFVVSISFSFFSFLSSP